VEDVLARQPHIVHLGHAVATAQIASVSHGKAEIPERPLVSVEDHSTSL
jgi:hypothetical protein